MRTKLMLNVNITIRFGQNGSVNHGNDEKTINYIESSHDYLGIGYQMHCCDCEAKPYRISSIVNTVRYTVGDESLSVQWSSASEHFVLRQIVHDS